MTGAQTPTSLVIHDWSLSRERQLKRKHEKSPADQMPFHDLIGKLASSVQLSHRIPSNARSPRRLNDNLHWKCPACKSRVKTRDTQFHLIGCLMSIVQPVLEPMSRFTGLVDNIDDRRAFQSPDRRPLIRPKTRVVRRPTPNIQHPIITLEDCSDIAVSKKGFSLRPVATPDLNKKTFVQRSLSHLTKWNMISLPSLSSSSSPEASSSNSSACEKQLAKEGVKLNQKRKLQSRRDNDSLGRQGSGSEDLSQEVRAMSRLVVKGRKKHSPTPATDVKVNKESTAACNATAWANFKSSLVPCSKCGRNFFSYRVATHEKLCSEPPQSRSQDANPSQRQKEAHNFQPRHK